MSWMLVIIAVLVVAAVGNVLREIELSGDNFGHRALHHEDWPIAGPWDGES